MACAALAAVGDQGRVSSVDRTSVLATHLLAPNQRVIVCYCRTPSTGKNFDQQRNGMKRGGELEGVQMVNDTGGFRYHKTPLPGVVLIRRAPRITPKVFYLPGHRAEATFSPDFAVGRSPKISITFAGALLECFYCAYFREDRPPGDNVFAIDESIRALGEEGFKALSGCGFDYDVPEECEALRAYVSSAQAVALTIPDGVSQKRASVDQELSDPVVRRLLAAPRGGTTSITAGPRPEGLSAERTWLGTDVPAMLLNGGEIFINLVDAMMRIAGVDGIRVTAGFAGSIPEPQPYSMSSGGTVGMALRPGASQMGRAQGIGPIFFPIENTRSLVLQVDVSSVRPDERAWFETLNYWALAIFVRCHTSSIVGSRRFESHWAPVLSRVVSGYLPVQLGVSTLPEHLERIPFIEGSGKVDTPS